MSSISLKIQDRISFPTLPAEAENGRINAGLTIPGWTECGHPEGCMYFYNSKLHVLTPVDIRVPGNWTMIKDGITNILRLLSEATRGGLRGFIEGFELFVTILAPEAGTPHLRYYIVNHFHKIIVGLNGEPVASPGFMGSGTPISNLWHGSLYWAHMVAYPSHVRLDKSFIPNILPMLKFHGSRPWDFPFNQEECNTYLVDLRKICKRNFEHLEESYSTPGENNMIAKICKIICNYFVTPRSGGSVPGVVVQSLGSMSGTAGFWPI